MTNCNSKRVTVVVPVYTDKLSLHEIISLNRLYKVLGNYPIVFVLPESLSREKIISACPTAKFESFPDSCFHGIKAYNSLMMSLSFYERFLDSEYILIYQLDCYIFRDELEYWCSKGHDYIGAPWIKRAVYDLPVIKSYMKLSRFLTKLTGKPDRQELFNRVGNGGLSLRKVESHYNFIVNHPHVVERFIKARHYHLYNEDVFWSIEVNKHPGVPFSYPNHITALNFSFDKHPGYCYKLNGNRLPFGCHSWSQKKMIGFWRGIILKDKNDKQYS